MFFSDLVAAVGESERETLAELWSLVWAGAVTNDAWQPLRSGAALRAVEPPRPGALRAAGQADRIAPGGARPLVARRGPARSRRRHRASGPGRSPRRCSTATAW